MKKIILSAIACLAFNILLAQQSPTAAKDQKRLADNVAYARQSALLDSVISKHMHKETPRPLPPPSDDFEDMDEFGEIPADNIYEGVWGTEGVNDFRTELDKVPDSVTFDCRGYVQPIPEAYTTSCFGARRYRYHYGIDLRVSMGDPIGTAFDGKVRITGFDKGGYGNYVVIRHNNGLETVYGHLSAVKVFVGENVVAGQLIGLGGSTGRSTGPHLHFETRFLGNPINPEHFFNFATGKVRSDKYFMVKSVAFAHVAEATALKAQAKAVRYHKVRSGETLSRIASRYGVSVSRLCKMNRIKQGTKLRAGQKIRYN